MRHSGGCPPSPEQHSPIFPPPLSISLKKNRGSPVAQSHQSRFTRASPISTLSPAQPAARAPQAKIRGLRREKEHFSIDFRRNALPMATESCRAIVHDVQHIGAALLRAGALDRRHHMLWRRWQRRGEPAARPFGELYARWRVITVAQWRRTARHRSWCRPRASAQAARRPHHH